MNRWMRALAPWLFVFLWSTGFIGSKLGAPYAEPLTFLFIRFVLAALLLVALVPILKEVWPNSLSQVMHASVVGVLLHGCYLGAVFIAIDRGVDAGFTALVVGAQPLLTVALAALWLNEAVNGRKLVGIAAGLAGISLVIIDRGISVQGVDTTGLLFCTIALIGITVGTLYQKRFCAAIPLVSGAAVQYVAVAVVLLPIALVFETQTITWAPTFIFALTWLVLVLSLGAVLLLMHLLSRGEAGQVASLFYLVPPVVAVQAWVLFDEQLTSLALIGFVSCAVGVAVLEVAAVAACPGGDNEHWPRSKFGTTGVCTMSCNSLAPPT